LDDPSFKKRGIFKGKPMTSFSSVVWDDEGFAFTGGANGAVYRWGKNRICDMMVQAHKEGHFISALALRNGKLYSGAKDNKIVTMDPNLMTVLDSIDTESRPIAIDMHGSDFVYGMRNGTIMLNGKAVMKSHHDGEVWGLDYIEGHGPVTAGDDNKVMFWSDEHRISGKVVEVSNRKVNAQRGGASTLADNFDS
jgi:hypothetical protein